MKQFKSLAISVIAVLAVATIVSIICKQVGIEPNTKIDEAQAKKVENHQKKVQKQYDDRVNDVNIDEISLDAKGYQIAQRSNEKDGKLVNPKSIKVYSIQDGKQKDITHLGDTSFSDDRGFIYWTYNFDKGADVKKDVKPILGDRVVFDVTYDKKAKSKSETKESQFVRKQKTDIARQVRDEKYQEKTDTDAYKKHKKQLDDTEKWHEKSKNAESKTHRYDHEIRYIK